VLEVRKIKRIILFLIIALLCTSLASAKFTKKDVVYENEPKLYLTGENTGYIVEIVVVSDTTREIVFSVNGEKTPALEEDESFRFSDNSEILPTTIIIDENGEDYVEYYFTGYTGKEFDLKEKEAEPEIEEEVEEKSKESTDKIEPSPEPTIEPEMPKKGLFTRILDWLKALF